MTSRLRVVPLPRVLRHGMIGRDVSAVQRALKATGIVLAHARQREYDTGTEAGVRTFQHHQKLPADGVYGPATHARLAPSFDAYGAWLMGLREHYGPEAARRAAIVAAMTLLLNHPAEVHYSQAPNRMEGVVNRLRPPRFPAHSDCSSAATWAYFAAGAPDPNGRGYDGFGYTGTLCQHGKSVPLEDAQLADLVFYGDGPPWGHVAVYVGNGRVISHGSEGGPYLLAVDYRADRGDVRTYPMGAS